MDAEKLKTKNVGYIQKYLTYINVSDYYKPAQNQRQYLRELDTSLMPILPKRKPKPLSQMKLLRLDDMKLEQAHPGRFLRLKMVLDCFRMNGVQLLCEDHTQQTCIIVQVCNFDYKCKPFYNYFKDQTVLYVKEPFYKSGMVGLFVYDMRYLLFEDHAEVRAIQWEKKGKVEAAAEVKQRSLLELVRVYGLDLMKKQLFYEAYFHYSAGIRRAKDKNYLIKFILNKAIVCSNLNFIGEYCENLDILLKYEPNHKKGLYHKAKYFVMIGQYVKAQELIREKKNYLGQDAQKQILRLIKVEKQQREELFINWYAAFTRDEACAVQTMDIQITDKGVFAVNKIQTAQILMLEKPTLFDRTFPTENGLQITQLLKNLDKLYEYSPDFKTKVDNMIKRYVIKKGQELKEKYSTEQIWRIILNYTFYRKQISEKDTKLLRNSFQILYLENIGFVNNSCEENCHIIDIGKQFKLLYTIREIQKGQEILLARFYELDYNKRRKLLKEDGIQNCRCLMCLEQEQEMISGKPIVDGKSLVLRRQKMMQKVINGEQNVESMYQFYDMASIMKVMSFGKNIELAAKMLRKIFIISEEESIEILQRYAAFTKKQNSY